MAIYFFLLIGTVAAGIPLCSKKCGKTGKAIFCAAAAVVFIVIAALRFQVGYDFNLYGGIYFNMKYMLIEDIMLEKMEKGFLLPLYVLNLVFEDYRTVFLYTSLIIYPSVFYLIYKNSSSPWISTAAFLCFGIFFNSLCFLRQFIAALIVAYAIKYIGEKNPLRFFVLTIAAASFHWSALIMLGVYFLLIIKPNKIYLGIVTVGTVIFCIFSRSVMYWVIDNFYMYRNYNPDTNVEASNGLPIRYTVMFGIIFLISFIFRKRLIEKNSNNSIYINCLMYTVVFEAMGTRHGILSRFALLVYLPAVLSLIPDLVITVKEYVTEKISSEKRAKVIAISSAIIGTVFSVGCYTMLMLSNYNGTVPYVSQMDRPTDIFVEEIADVDDEEENWEEIDWVEEGFTGEEWESEEWLDYDWDSEEWEDEFDEEAFEEDILSQLT